MRKVIVVITIFSLLSLSGCVTNDFTEEDYEKGKKPMGPGLSAISGIIPGLPQLLHGEYLESAIYFSVFVAGTAGVNIYAKNEDEALPGKEIQYYTSSGLAYSGWIASISDGFMTGMRRRNQYSVVQKKRVKEQREEVFKQNQKRQKREEKLRELQEKREKERIREQYDERTAQAILNKEIFIGMSRSALIESWGRPQEINTTVTKYSKTEQFVYGDFGPYVYVEDGKVISWQKSEQ